MGAIGKSERRNKRAGVMVAIKAWFKKPKACFQMEGVGAGGLRLSGKQSYLFPLSTESCENHCNGGHLGTVCPKDSPNLPCFVQHSTASCLSSKKIRAQSVLVNSSSLGHTLKSRAMSPPLCNSGKCKWSQPQPNQWQDRNCLHRALR